MSMKIVKLYKEWEMSHFPKVTPWWRSRPTSVKWGVWVFTITTLIAVAWLLLDLKQLVDNIQAYKLAHP